MVHKSSMLTFLLVAFASLSLAQVSPTDTLSIERDFFGGNTYLQGASEISSGTFETALRTSPDTTVYPMYSSASTRISLAQVLGFAGGFGFGYGLFSKPTNTGLAVGGSVVILLSFILEAGGNASIDEAVSLHNKALLRSGTSNLIYPGDGFSYSITYSFAF